MRNFFISYPYVVYSILTWGLALFILKPSGIRRLWYVPIISSIVLFLSMVWITGIGVFKFNINFLPIRGIPFFLLLWGAASGLIFIHFLGSSVYQRILSVIVFAGITVGLESIVEHYKRVQHLGTFNNWYEFIFDTFILSMLGFIVTSIWRQRDKQ